MLHIDGSYGEGGGQILRSSLSLAAITGQPVRIDRIRANRSKPGLAIQHLTSVRAIASLCQAQVKGDAVGSMALEFVPTRSLQAGHYRFDVAETVGSGSAGAITLILQTVLLPLALVRGASIVTLRGGTFVPWSPAITYIQEVYLPFLKQMGVQAEARLNAWGWYPQGNGEVELHITGNASPLSGIEILERGELQQVRGIAVVTKLPSHIPQRMANRAENLLREVDLKGLVKPLQGKGIAPGAGIFLMADYAHSRSGFGAVGKPGLPAEKVAELAVKELLNFHHTGAPIDAHMGDQLLLPAALSSEPSHYRVSEISTHLMTNAWVLEQFGVATVAIANDTQTVTVQPSNIK